jgi:hypothetical protein
MQSSSRPFGFVGLASILGLMQCVLFFSSCSGDDGDDGAPGAPGAPGDPAPTDTVLTRPENAPGVVLTLTSVSGASGSDGTFQIGDHVAVHFTLTKTDGSAWALSEMSTARMLVSGPTFNYQPVLSQVSDVATMAVHNADGSYTYTFATPIPSTYLPPLNDTTAFGAGDGELAGQALLAGSYTVGAYFAWNYTVEGESFKDVGNSELNFQFGGSTVADARAVVGQDNCNRCHTTLQAHGGSRRDVTLCLLCHTAGSEDSSGNGVSIDFRVMIHKIHDGEHLPSVLGVSTNMDGSRNYATTPTPYVVGGDDFSHVAFPVFPNATIPMPRDAGYTALTSAQKAVEDSIREGAANCAICHGDPDGSGPITAPAQGDLILAQPSRQSCGSCHDDVNWGLPYTANMQTMGSQANNSNCVLCHTASSGPISVEGAHRHPLLDPSFNPGLNIAVSNLAESGTNNGDGRIDPGEKVAITFTIQDDMGVDVPPSSLSSISAVISGPTNNYNLLLSDAIPVASLTGSPPFTVNVPQKVVLEYVGDSTAALESFVTALTPHWTPTNSLTTVQVRTATSGGSSTLSAAVVLPVNHVDVADSTGFAHDDYVVIADGVGGSEEYLRIQQVDGTRLWFGSPASTTYAFGPRHAHAAGTTVKEVTLTTKTATTDYTVNAATGTITEVTEFGATNAVVVSYTTDFVMPATFPLAINDSPDLDQSWGKWAGLPIEPGTYTFGMWGQQNLSLALFGETNSYRNVSLGHHVDFLVGAASVIEPYDLISSASNCQACHQDIYFHGGGRRGFDTCVLCHGTAGSEDRAQYVAAAAPATTGTTINFRTMLHKIHMGSSLTHAADYELVGFGSGAWPNNFGVSTYEDIVFPSMSQGVGNCVTCHGTSTAWEEPAPREHFEGQDVPTRAWRAVCGSCHDSEAAAAHIDVQTSALGQESCAVCHGPGRELDVTLVHKVR